MVDNRGPQLTAVVSTMVSMAVVTMSLRAYVRLWIRGWGLDDWFMLSAVVSQPKQGRNLPLSRSID